MDGEHQDDGTDDHCRNGIQARPEPQVVIDRIECKRRSLQGVQRHERARHGHLLARGNERTLKLAVLDEVGDARVDGPSRERADDQNNRKQYARHFLHTSSC